MARICVEHGNAHCAELAWNLERQCFGKNQGTAQQLANWLKGPAGCCAFATSTGLIGSKVVGYTLYTLSLHSGLLQLLQVGVVPAFRRRGIAAALLQKLLTDAHRAGVTAHCRCPERNLPAQLLLRSCAWKCHKVEHNAFPDGQDAYLFHYPAYELVES